MDPWTGGARRILERSATGAAPLSRILAWLEEEGVEARGREPWVLRRLVEQPGLFRVLPDLGNPFRSIPLLPEGEHRPHQLRSGPQDPGHHPFPSGPREPGHHPFPSGLGEPWVLLRSPSPTASGSGDPAVRRLQETLGAWGRTLDEESPRAVARWVRATLEAEGACSHLLRVEGHGP